MDSAAILALISNLYVQVTQQAQTIEQMQAHIDKLEAEAAADASPPVSPDARHQAR